MCTGGMDSVTQALKSYCEAEYMEDTNMYKCGSETCKGEEQNAHKSLHFQVGSYYSKIGEKRYIFLVNLVNCCELPSLRMFMNRKRCSPIYVSPSVFQTRRVRLKGNSIAPFRSAVLLRCGVSLRLFAAPYLCSVPSRRYTVQFRCNVRLKCSVTQFRQFCCVIPLSCSA